MGKSIKRPITISLDEKYFVLLQDYTVRLIYKGFDWQITVPRGYKYDGASVPRALWTLSGLYPAGLILAGATVHDWMYQNRHTPIPVKIFNTTIKQWEEKEYTFSRLEADEIFDYINLLSGVDYEKRKKAFTFVRWFGWVKWNSKHRHLTILNEDEFLMYAKNFRHEHQDKSKETDRGIEGGMV